MNMIDWTDDETRTEVIAILAAFQAANQTTQQAGQNSNQSISDLLQNQAQTAGGSTIESNIGDIGGDEALEKELIDESGTRSLNRKRTYDTYQQVDLNAIGQNRVLFDTAVIDGHIEGMSLKNVALQSVSNLVENANMVAKQAIRDAALATDRQWNVDEQGYTAKGILNDQTFKDGIKALLIESIGEVVRASKTE